MLGFCARTFRRINLPPSRFASTICYKKVSKLTLISLNRPEKINAINKLTIHQLRDAIDNFENDPDSNIAVLYGTGGNFSSGFDLEELNEFSDEQIIQYLEEFHEFLKRPPKKPIIAAINGYAVGQALDLALWCDLRIIEENALLGFYNRRFGIPICPSTVDSLKTMIGTTRTMFMILGGRHISAKQALDWGICHRMSTLGTGIGEALDFANKISRSPQECLLIDRALLLSNSNQSTETHTERNRIQEICLKKYRFRIEQFVKKQFGRHGSFKTEFEDDLAFLENM